MREMYERLQVTEYNYTESSKFQEMILLVKLKGKYPININKNILRFLSVFQ